MIRERPVGLEEAAHGVERQALEHRREHRAGHPVRCVDDHAQRLDRVDVDEREHALDERGVDVLLRDRAALLSRDSPCHQFLPGTDFVTSGYSVMPRADNTFGGGNYDADDLDEWLTIQRDWQVDAGIEPISEADVTRVRERAARAVQAVFTELGLPPVTDAEVEAATVGYDSLDMPDRDRAADVEAADAALERGVSGLDVALALDRHGFGEIAEAIVGMQRQRVSADYLQTSSVIDADGLVHSAVSDPNVYSGPGTGYRLEGERWELLQALPHVTAAEDLVAGERHGDSLRPVDAGRGRARRSGGGRRSRGGRRRRRPRFRGQRSSRRSTVSHTTKCWRQSARGFARAAGRRASCVSGVTPTSRSSGTTARSCPDRASPLESSRKGRR